MHRRAGGCRHVRHSQCLSTNTDMNPGLLASSRRTSSALTQPAVGSLPLFLMTDQDYDEFNQDATTRGAVWKGCGVETVCVRGECSLGTLQWSMQAKWQPCDWLEVTATSAGPISFPPGVPEVKVQEVTGLSQSSITTFQLLPSNRDGGKNGENGRTGWVSGFDELVLDPRVNVGRAFKDSQLDRDRQTLPHVQHFCYQCFDLWSHPNIS